MKVREKERERVCVQDACERSGTRRLKKRALDAPSLPVFTCQLSPFFKLEPFLESMLGLVLLVSAARLLIIGHFFRKPKGASSLQSTVLLPTLALSSRSALRDMAREWTQAETVRVAGFIWIFFRVYVFR